MSKPASKSRPDNRSTIIKGFVKPTILGGFPGTKAPTNFKPTARMGTINRGRR